MNISIIGAGAIGLLLGAKLSHAGHRITMVTRRKEQSKKLIRSGIQYNKGQLKENFTVHASTELPSDQDIVIVAVKSQHVKEVIPFLSGMGSNSQTPELLFVQNGMGHIHHLQSLSTRICVGTIEHGAKKQGETAVTHTGEGSVKISSYSGECRNIHNLSRQMSFEFVEEWYKLLSEKLIINCGINPLTALFHIKNGELLTNARFFGIMRELIKESSKVLELEFEESWNRVQKICRYTATNTSSMFADLKAGRRTEIDAITGFIMKQAAIKGVDVPFTRFVYDSIKGLEMKMEERQ